MSAVETIDIEAQRAKPRPKSAAGNTLIGLSKPELAEALSSIGVPDKQIRMRVNQIWNWLYVRGVSDFSEMTNMAKDLRAKMAETFDIARPEIVTEQISTDGTRKWLMRFPAHGAGRPVEIGAGNL